MSVVDVIALVFGNYAVFLGVLVCVWLISLPLKNASIVDIAWGLLFVVAAWRTCAVLSFPAHGVVVASLVTVWGLRLAGFLAWRNLGHGEDARYQMLRKKYVPFWLKSLGIVFVLQATLASIVALPIQLAQLPRGDSVLADVVFVVGAVVAVGGVIFESVADLQMQLHRRRRAPGEKSMMTTGLWRYSRHPNYFGETVVWWGFAVMSVSTALSTSTSALALFGVLGGVLGAVLITWLLLRLSGVPMLERMMAERPGFADYVARTSAFVPRRPR